MFLKNEYTLPFYREKLMEAYARDSSGDGNSLVDHWYRLTKIVTVKSSQEEICHINDDLGFYFQNFSTFLRDFEYADKIYFQGARLYLEESGKVRLSGRSGSQMLSLKECLSLYDQVVEGFRAHVSMLDELLACSDYASDRISSDLLKHINTTFFLNYRDVIVKIYGDA